MLRVVLADDEKKVLLLMCKLIDWESLGFEIVGMASDGMHALEMIRDKQPHLLVTDIRMPGFDGIDLIRQAKQVQPGLHFIVVSGYAQFEYAQNALKYGVEGYLLKPLKVQEMTDLLTRLKGKLSEQATIEYRLKKSDEREQERIIDTLIGEIHGDVRTSSAVRSFNLEYGLPSNGCYFAAIVKPDIPSAWKNPDGVHAMMKHALEIVRQELGQLKCRSHSKRRCRCCSLSAGVPAGRGQAMLHQNTQGNRKAARSVLGHPCDNLPWQPMLRCRCAWRFYARGALAVYRSSVSYSGLARCGD